MSLFHHAAFVPVQDVRNTFSRCFEIDHHHRCYVEPGFMALLRAIEEREPHHMASILNEMLRIVREHHHVVFALDFNHPITRHIDGFIVLELHDVLDRLNLHFPTVNTGSHLGD